MANLVDLYIVYRILRMLTTPYENWEAYKTGVIDKDGKIIVKPNKRTPEQKDSYTKFDNLMLKLKQVLGTIPFGKTRLASYAAALLLLKEQDTLTEENIKERFLDFYKKRYLTEKWSDKYKRSIDCDNPKGFSQKAHCQGKEKNEEIANVAGSGQVAGLGDDPPVGKKAQNKLIRRGKFANNDTFIVSSDVMKNARMGKKKFVKYEKYVGNGEVGKAIRDFGRKNPKKPIILQDEITGSMIFLRYGKSGMFEESNPRIPRKKGQPANSDKHSDLYTDENPKGTIKGLKFATKEDAENSVNKIKSSGRTHAHKIQAAIAMEQRAKVMGKVAASSVYRKFINSMKKKTKKMNEDVSLYAQWEHQKPVKFAQHLTKTFGKPDELTNKQVVWHNKDGFKRIVVRDEYILHGSPAPHYDFVYCYVDVKVPHEFAEDMAKSSESIMIDYLKGEAGARCGSLTANAVTLNYVLDVVAGRVKPSKKEYEKRILDMSKIFNSGKRFKINWWPDESGDADPEISYHSKKKDKKQVKEQILEDVTRSDLDKVESYADRLFKAVGIDIEFTRHFLDRVNDARNKKEITVQELASLFKKTFEKYGKKIASLGDNAEAVINDMKSDINMPFVLDLNRRTKEIELIAKTVMRKKNFMTRNLKLRV